MDNIPNIVRTDGFAVSLMDQFPWGILIVDENSRVYAMNDVFARTFHITRQSAIEKGIGNAVGCFSAMNHPEGCGHQEQCRTCEPRLLALTAFKTSQKQEAKVRLPLLIDGKLREVVMHLTATPFQHQEKQFVLLVVQSIKGLHSELPQQAFPGFQGMVGQSDKMQEVFDMVRQVSRTSAPVLIQGESGTGKELVALAIHNESPRASRHFVPFNCGALPEGLVESELFGHLRGAFTGSVRNKKGRFELADGGTLFLDEVGELSPPVQVKLLRVLQEGCFERLGDEHTTRIDVRIVSATNRKLEAEVAAGRFRKDLYYRLCVMPVTVPPLKERSDDVTLLARHFLTAYAEEYGFQTGELSPAARAVLTAYDWPGNVRELQNVVQYALVKSQGKTISPAHLPPAMLWNRTDFLIEKRDGAKLRKTDVIQALKEAGGNKKEAAKALGVSRSTLYRFFEKHEKDWKNSINN